MSDFYIYSNMCLKIIRNKKIMLIYHYNMPIINGELFNNVLSIAMIFQANLTLKMKQVVWAIIIASIKCGNLTSCRRDRSSLDFFNL